MLVRFVDSVSPLMEDFRDHSYLFVCRKQDCSEIVAFFAFFVEGRTVGSIALGAVARSTSSIANAKRM